MQLTAGLDLTAYRIVQEALTNTLKHSGAGRAEVRLDYGPSSLLVEITDDGTATPADDATGHGLVGIRERVAMFGGTATAGPAPGGGWRVRTELPVLPSTEALRVATP